MMKLLKMLGVKPTHFKDGWASFDAVDYNLLTKICENGGKLKLEPNTSKSTVILHEYPQLMGFGKVSNNGDVIIQGITGFPNDNTCVRYLKDVSGLATKKKIKDNYIYIEW